MGGWMRIEMKRALIKHNYYERPGLSQRELAAWAKVQFKLKKAPAQTTVSDILKRAATIMDEAYGDNMRRKPLRVTSLRLEKCLWAWLQELENQHVCVSRELIRLKARDLQVELCDAWDLSLSDGWLTAYVINTSLVDLQTLPVKPNT
ncbi:hypothetical protein PI124_g20843 [Phytophthora idaei]|nr:hypothetical protein PI125_g22326 [Phytophthora idaei]KAG3130272.1 hypothetical protein PI126_g20588 [Phytophthora idaei]KAG3234103.1 hypothetical protein PI124_g20843 [Phytophthora idaei]